MEPQLIGLLRVVYAVSSSSHVRVDSTVSVPLLASPFLQFDTATSNRFVAVVNVSRDMLTS